MDLTERTGGRRAEHLSVPCVFGCLRKGPVRRADAVGDVIRLCVVGMMEKERDKRAENGVKSFFAGYAIAVSLIVPDNF